MIIKDFSPCACTLTYFTYSHCGAKFRNKHICYVFSRNTYTRCQFARGCTGLYNCEHVLGTWTIGPNYTVASEMHEFKNLFRIM